MIYYNKEWDVISSNEWSNLRDDFEYRKIKHSENDDYFVSTVFTWMNYNLWSKNPLIFETMVFKKKDWEINYRDIDVAIYATLKEAKEWHEEMCKKYLW